MKKKAKSAIDFAQVWTQSIRYYWSWKNWINSWKDQQLPYSERSHCSLRGGGGNWHYQILHNHFRWQTSISNCDIIIPNSETVVLSNKASVVQMRATLHRILTEGKTLSCWNAHKKILEEALLALSQFKWHLLHPRPLTLKGHLWSS